MKVLPCCLLFLFCSPCWSATPQVCSQNSCVSVEVVTKEEDMERGLMYRNGLDADKGMFFVFNNDDKHAFWMKNMRFSLDILWLDADGRIVYIGQNLPACSGDPCPVYTPDQNARYVLEVQSGYTADHQWKLGQKLDLKNILKT